MSRRLRRDEYTVGWICTLPVEVAPAQAMLDEEHDDLERDINDHDKNIYCLGSIRGRNVAIVCLPGNWIGNNPAAVVAARMRATFKAIRFGLIVGIGEGVPSAEADIRLGGVVVSQPYQTSSGVIQRDPTSYLKRLTITSEGQHTIYVILAGKNPDSHAIVKKQ